MQTLGNDVIGKLTENAGTISLAPSLLTVGGRQFVTPGLQVAVTTGSNTLFMIYAVLNSGNIELVVTTNVNSVGPAGFPTYKLVGAYYTDNITNAFGSFVTIEGSPKTYEEIIHNPLISTNSGAIAAGTGGDAHQRGNWSRDGKIMSYRFVIRFGTTGLGTGNSNYECLLPGVLSRTPTPPGDGSGGFEAFGYGSLFDQSAAQAYGFVFGAGQTTPNDEIVMLVEERNSSATVVSASLPFSWNTGDIMRGQLHVGIQEWSSEPLVSL